MGRDFSDTERCCFCGEEAQLKQPWDWAWSKNCAKSVYELLDVDLFSLSFFESAEYCRLCKELIRDVDFLMNSVRGMRGRLEEAKQKIAQMLLDKFYNAVNGDSENIVKLSTISFSSVSNNKLPCPENDTHLNSDQKGGIEMPVSLSVPSPSSSATTNAAAEWLGSDCMDMDTWNDDPRILEDTETEEKVVPHNHAVTESITYPPQELTNKDDNTRIQQLQFRCAFPKCELEFTNISALDSHQPSHKGWRPYKCTHGDCDQTFIRKHHLVRHQHRHVIRRSGSTLKTNKEKLEKCKPGTILKNRLLKLKERQNTLPKAKLEFACGFENCEKKFPTFTILQRHQVTHDGWRPYRCTIDSCDATFGWIQHYSRHLNRWHSKSKLEREGTEGKSGETDGKKFCCDFQECEKKFQTRYFLERHQSSHPGWRGYKCIDDQCSKTFMKRQHLFSHVKKRHQKCHKTDSKQPAEPTLNIAVQGTGNNQEKEGSSIVTKAQTESKLEESVAQSSNRRSSRLLSIMPKRQIIEEDFDCEDKEPDFVVSDSDTSISFDSDIEEEENFITPNAREGKRLLNKGPGRPGKPPQIGPYGFMVYPANFRRQVERISEQTYSVPNDVRLEVMKATTHWLPKWDSILPKLATPSESYEETFSFLLILDQMEQERDNAFACQMKNCHRRMRTMDRWKGHMLKIHGQSSTLFECPFCEPSNVSKTRTTLSRRLDAHIDRVHLGLSHPYPCPVPLCDSRYYFENQLIQHMESQHPSVPYETEKREYPKRVDVSDNSKPSKTLYCKHDGCLYRTQYPKFLEAHVIKKHGTDANAKAYNCDTCGRGFTSISTYRSHKRGAHKGQDEQAKCPYCNRTFSFNYRLNDHIRFKHRMVVPKFVCEICERTNFIEISHKVHQDLHEKSRQWQCVMGCGGDPFDSKEALVTHVKVIHEQLKEIVCHVCGVKKTGRHAESYMKAHMRSHSQEKTTKCRFCDKLFRHSSEVLYHEQRVHADQEGVKTDYKCDECGEQFQVYLYFYRHCRNKHGSNPMPKFKRKKSQEDLH